MKWALYADCIAIERPWETADTAFAVTIQLEPIPFSVKVVLFGDLNGYMSLSGMHLDFGNLFKLDANFDEITERDDEYETLFAHMIPTVQRRVTEHCSRVVTHAERLAAWVGLDSSIKCNG
jgi:predicted ATP-dependent protease